MLVSPTTLMMALRIIDNLWQVEKQNRNAQDIAQRAGALYDKLQGVVEKWISWQTIIPYRHLRYALWLLGQRSRKPRRSGGKTQRIGRPSEETHRPQLGIVGNGDDEA